MGKSGKKSKSDKINALRKQYDAFLEEDKKRKDRNEYILGRMETMRSCTTLVQVGSKAYPKTEECRYLPQPKYNSTTARISNSALALSDRAHVTPTYSNINYDEPSVLREISKKYFLIPKVISNVLDNVNYKANERDPSPIDDTDWKSKYNILDELKREEKGESNIKYEKPNNNLGDSYQDKKHSEYIAQESNENSTVKNNNNLSLELEPMKSENALILNKELSVNNVEVKPNQTREEQNNKSFNDENIGVTAESNIEKQEIIAQSNNVLQEVNLPARSSPSEETQVENNTKDSNLISNNNMHETKESNELCVEKIALKMEPIEALENKKYLPEEKSCNEFSDPQDKTANYKLNNDNNILSPVVNNKNTMEVNNENKAFSVKNVEDNQVFVHDNTVIAQGVNEEVAGNLQEDPAIDNAVHQDYQHQESHLKQNLNIEQNVTSEVNDELETEQKEMFYSEDNDKDNQYNATGDTTYPAADENYINQEYSYYDESQKEQTYPTEINEHEESTEPYDPNYEQQYVNNYDNTMNVQYQPEQYNVQDSYDQPQNMYDQQQSEANYQPENPNYEYAPVEGEKGTEENQNLYYTNAQDNAQYEAEAQQFENTEIVDQPNAAYTTSEYDAQQEYITTVTEPQELENVEQQLDLEDGYILNSNKVEENQNYQEQVTEETTPEIQQSDPNLT